MLRNICKLHLHCLMLAVVLILMTPFLTGFDNPVRQVTINYDGKSQIVRTAEVEPQVILQQAGVTLAQGDSWQLQNGRRVREGSVIEVLRAKSFTVIRGEETLSFKSSKATVGEALKDVDVSFNKKRLYPPATTPLEENMQVYVLQRGEELHFSEASVEIPVQYEEDHNLDFGKEHVVQDGKPGKATVISKRVKNKDGAHTIHELTREVVVAPESKVIRKGMAMSVLTPEGYKRYTKKMVVNTTAYVATGNRTAIGLIPYVGIVAVDPRVIPFYTKMYIPGYGIGMAGDTGGAIIGHIIDLFFDDYHAAIQWGRRDVEIYILADE